MVQFLTGAGATAAVRERAVGDFLLIVPTSTLAEHLQNELARAHGFVRPRSVVTLARMLDRWVPDLAPVSPALLDQALRAIVPATGFGAVAGFPGFRDRLAGVLDELISAGADATALRRFDPQLTVVLAGLEPRIAGRHWRSQRVRAAAERIRGGQVLLPSRVLVDSFRTFAPAEVELLKAIASRTELVVAVPEDASPQDWGFAEPVQFIEGTPPAPLTYLVMPTIEREAGAIASEILDLHRNGRAFREIGVVVRSREPYGRLIGSTLARYGIPHRAYFPRPLAEERPIPFLASVVEALLDGWSYTRLLEVVRDPAGGWFGTREGDEVAAALASRQPDFGLEHAGPLRAVLTPLSPWRTLERTPAQWAATLATLYGSTARPRQWEPSTLEAALARRAQAEALTSWSRALEETATLLPSRAVRLERFWQEAREVLRLHSVTARDGRRDVVHLMDAYEARQWRLPVLFVAGLLEGEFPRRVGADPILPGATRLRLRQAGFPLRGLSEWEAEETALLASLRQAATAQITYSWHQFDAAGEPTLPSFALGQETAPSRTPPPLLPRPGSTATVPPWSRFVAPEAIAARRRATWRPTEIETFLGCAFRHFAQHTLRLNHPPADPEDRFGPLERGIVVHEILRKVHEEGIDHFDRLFAQSFDTMQRQKYVADSHRTEFERLELERYLRRFLAQPPERLGWTMEAEWPFEFTLAPGVVIRGRIDRFDRSSTGEAYAIDYKYQTAEKAREKLASPEAVQGGLYLIALKKAGLTPVGFAYLPLKGDGEPVETDQVDELMQTARERTLLTVERVLAGEVEPRPHDPKICRWCDYRDVCRIRGAAAQIAAEATP